MQGTEPAKCGAIHRWRDIISDRASRNRRDSTGPDDGIKFPRADDPLEGNCEDLARCHLPYGSVQRIREALTGCYLSGDPSLGLGFEFSTLSARTIRRVNSSG